MRSPGRSAALRWLATVFLVGSLLVGAPVEILAARSTAGTTAVAEPVVVDGDPLVALVPARPEAPAVFAVGSAGLYRSDDGGRSWQLAGPPPPPGQVIAAEDSPLVLLVGSHPPCAQGGGGPPLQRSVDGGATWMVVEGTDGVRPLAIWTEASLALGASCAGLQLSTDAGETWQAARLIEPGFDVSAFAPIEGTVPAPLGLVAGTSEGGTTRVWRVDLSDPARPTAGDVLVEFWGGGALAGRDQLFVVGTSLGVLVSADGGASWVQSRAGLEDVTLSADPRQGPIPEDELSRGYGISAVAIDPARPEQSYVGTVDGVFASTDQGATWQEVAGTEGWVMGLVLASPGGRLLVQTEDGVVALALPG
jgi:hypothetical protein